MSNPNVIIVGRRKWQRMSPLAATILLLAAGVGYGTPAWAQQKIVVEAQAVDKPKDEAEDEDKEGLDGEGRYLGGAPLKTDPDLMARLKKAGEYQRDGNYRVASRLWQSVLEESGDTLYTKNGETYYALTEQVESILAGLPAEGLRAYRISADANAKELMAQAAHENDMEILSQIVKGYFLSSLGDDAAFRMGCIYLDHYDFVGAVRLLSKITQRYPDPSVPMDQVWLRMAIAYAYVGDLASAQRAFDQAGESGAEAGDRLYESVGQLIEQAPSIGQENLVAAHWNMRMGDARRLGVMPALPDDVLGTDLTPHWQFQYSPRDQYRGDEYEGTILTGADAHGEQARKELDRESSLIKNWKENRWRPAGSLLFTDDVVAFKTGADVMVLERGDDLPLDVRWRPLWLNQFMIDDATHTWKMMYDAYGRFGRSAAESRGATPSKALEIQLFGDQIAQSMSIYRGVLYNVEGKQYNWSDRNVPQVNRQRQYSWGTLSRRTRTNHLTAYDTRTGKLLWRLPSLERADKIVDQPDQQPDDAAEAEDYAAIGFMSAPVGFGDFLIVPINASGSIWLYALDSENQGALVWKSYLCDEPGGGSQPWSPIQISIDGSTAYVSCGTGVLFAVDPMTGAIRYARRYERTGKQNDMMRRFGNQMDILELDGWMEDLVIPAGNALIMFASDYNVVWAIDRQSTEFLWMTENRPFGHKFDYLIGVHNGLVFLGGQQSVAAISIEAEGRWEWVQSFDEGISLGRAMLTRDGLYVPVANTIVKYAIGGDAHEEEMQLGTELARANVDLGIDAPLGNLFSDGQRIWVVGANRIYALGPAPVKLPEEQPDSTDQDNQDDDNQDDDQDNQDDQQGDLGRSAPK